MPLKKVWSFDCNPPEYQLPRRQAASITATATSASTGATRTTARTSAPARSSPRPSSTRTASTWPSARTRRTAAAGECSTASTPRRPATSPRPARSGPTTRSTAACPPSPSPTGCSTWPTAAPARPLPGRRHGPALLGPPQRGRDLGLDLVADGKVYLGTKKSLRVLAAGREDKAAQRDPPRLARHVYARGRQRRALRRLAEVSLGRAGGQEAVSERQVASGELVGWVERSEPHHSSRAFFWWGSLRSTHPTSCGPTAVTNQLHRRGEVKVQWIAPDAGHPGPVS